MSGDEDSVRIGTERVEAERRIGDQKRKDPFDQCMWLTDPHAKYPAHGLPVARVWQWGKMRALFEHPVEPTRAFEEIVRHLSEVRVLRPILGAQVEIAQDLVEISIVREASRLELSVRGERD